MIAFQPARRVAPPWKNVGFPGIKFCAAPGVQISVARLLIAWAGCRGCPC